MSSTPATISVPGKTFLVGEYLALDGGPSIILTTEPRFVLRATRSRGSGQAKARRLPGAGRPHTFAGASPAGRLFVRHEADFSGWSFRFEDPHRGAGGLGASSAQFLLMYNWLMKTTNLDPDLYDWERLLEEYRVCAWNGEGHPPSGADIVAQCAGGGVCEFDGRQLTVRRHGWKFPRLTFSLLRTGVKLATHEHLKRAKSAPYDSLREIVRQASLAFNDRDENALVKAVVHYGEILAASGLTAESTLGLLSALKSQVPGALAAKGCGAMGADVVLVLHDRDKEAAITAWAGSKGLEICGSEKLLATTGLETL